MEDAAQEVLPPVAGPRGAPAVRLLRHVRGRDQGRRPARSPNSTAPTTRPRAAATPRTAARSRPRCTGSRPPTPWTAEVRLYDHLFTKPDPDDVPEGAGLEGQPQPQVAGGPDRVPASSQRSPPPSPATGSSSSGWATSASTRFAAGPAGLQPHRDAEGHVGEDTEEGASNRGR